MASDSTDVEAEELETEEVYNTGSVDAIRANLRKNGATKEEIDFLLDQRVELNAFASDHLVDWIERKLKEHGISKVVPTDETLADAYRRMRRQAVVQEHIDKALKELGNETSACSCRSPSGHRRQAKGRSGSALGSCSAILPTKITRPSHDPHGVQPCHSCGRHRRADRRHRDSGLAYSRLPASNNSNSVNIPRKSAKIWNIGKYTCCTRFVRV